MHTPAHYPAQERHLTVVAADVEDGQVVQLVYAGGDATQPVVAQVQHGEIREHETGPLLTHRGLEGKHHCRSRKSS